VGGRENQWRAGVGGEGLKDKWQTQTKKDATVLFWAHWHRTSLHVYAPHPHRRQNQTKELNKPRELIRIGIALFI
jgi:hypothetical protein